jgi:hypothetical protein
MARKTDVSQIEETVLCCCNLSAKVKIQTAAGWKNVCLGCYHKHHFQKSLDYCEALGLNDTASRIAWLKKHAAGITKRYTKYVPKSEPGVDYEEDAA